MFSSTTDYIFEKKLTIWSLVHLIQVKCDVINETSQDASDKRYQIVSVCEVLHNVWPEPHRENDGPEARSIIQKSSVCEKRYTLGTNKKFVSKFDATRLKPVTKLCPKSKHISFELSEK